MTDKLHINLSANAVQATEDGGVRMLTIIDNPNAPTAYDYKVTVPSGGHADPFFIMIAWPIVTYALRKCGIGFAWGAGGTIVIDGWNAWKVVAAGGLGCIERVAGGWKIIKHAFKFIRW